jgi:hypothetical protein
MDYKYGFGNKSNEFWLGEYFCKPASSFGGWYIYKNMWFHLQLLKVVLQF